MSTLAIAKKDFQDALRSRALIVLSVLFAVFAAGAVYVFSAVIDLGSAGNISPAVQLLFSIASPVSIFVPLIGVITGYRAIVGERSTGSVKILLSLPHTRRDVLFGKLAGRTAVLSVAVVVGFALAGVVGVVYYSAFPIAAYLGFVVLTLVLGIAYLAFSIGLSASTRSSSIALWGALGFFALFQFLWGFVTNLVVYVVNGFSTPANFSFVFGYLTGGPDWYQLLGLLSPSSAYQTALNAVLSAGGASGSTPYFLQSWFGIVILVIWIVVPLVFGYLRFNSTDL